MGRLNQKLFFRAATPDDFQLTFQIKKLSIKPSIDKIWGWDDEAQLNFHTQHFKPERVKIIQNEHHVDIGLLSLTEDSTCLRIENILICDFAQGQGIGTAILSGLTEKARSTGKRAELQVFKINERAMMLYANLGFKITGQTDLHYQMVFE